MLQSRPRIEIMQHQMCGRIGIHVALSSCSAFSLLLFFFFKHICSTCLVCNFNLIYESRSFWNSSNLPMTAR
ncbi:hypothetical protein Lalb_Chr25g0282371 [Lupinus albus]|uniref:Uncharacterized protein n=1 Tax=Lupinus albus TaxID=3870 RepID=A0A6A4MUD2_LUPAL|nr:hypothetical protein Lalb_Chr25g0282371 [Lupinus albus]